MSAFCYGDNVEIKEGQAKLFIPRATLANPHHCKVFYNRTMAFNRSLSSLFISSALSLLKIKKAKVFDGYSGTGIRGIRYALECPAIAKVFLCEANDDATPYIEKNIKLNKLHNTVVAHCAVNVALQREKFDVVELDPFGSPLPALHSALLACDSPSILSLTFTDLANLCGGRRHQTAKCLKEYGSKPMRCAFSHELALRIALLKVAKEAVALEIAISPLACWYEGHYVKLILAVEKNKIKKIKLKNQVGYAWLCRSCLERKVEKTLRKTCPACGAQVQVAGPLWTGAIEQREVLLAAVKGAGNEKTKKFVEKLAGELCAPALFYNVEEFSSIVKSSTPRLASVASMLQRKGFAASSTHFSPTGFKTNASARDVKKTIAAIAVAAKDEN